MSRGEGQWHPVGEVRLDAGDLAAAMAGLRAQAGAPAAEALASKIVLPEDQIRYITVNTGDIPPAARREAAARALDGATPYTVDELAFDVSAEGALTHVAAVARETLAEAEGFAVEHGFAPVSFVARPDPAAFPGEPFFGPAAHAAKVLAPGDAVEPDGATMVIGGPRPAPAAQPPEPPAETVDPAATPATAEPDGEDQTAEGAADGGNPPIAAPTPPAPPPATPDEAPAGFTSRRARPDETPASEAADIIPIPAHQRIPPRQSRPAPTVAAPGATAPQVGPRSAGLAPAAAPQRLAPASAPGVSPQAAAATLRAAPPAADGDGTARTGFMSRRRAQPAPPPPASRPVVADPALAPAMAAQPLPEPENDTARMTVFGARQKTPPQRSKPRFLGLFLTVILLIVLAGVAAFAAIFTDNPVSKLFSREPVVADVMIEEPAANLDEAAVDPRVLAMPVQRVEPQADVLSDGPEMGAADTGADNAPDLLPETDLALDGSGPAALTEDSLSETDAAVLDALAAPDEPDAEADTLAGDAAMSATAGDEDAWAATDLEALADDPLADFGPDPAAAPAAPAAAPDPATYAATGIWSTAPDHPRTPGVITLDDLFVAAIDGATLTQDALALPRPASFETDVSPSGVASPAGPGIAFKLDALGLVEPTPEGAVTPDGVLVYLGQPSKVPPPTPARVEPAETEEALQPALPDRRPRSRPGDLVENAERSRLGGLTLAELGGVRPRERPYEPELPEQAPPETIADAVEEILLSEADQRLAGLTPKARPSGFAATVEAAQAPAPRSQSASAGPAAAASTASNLAAAAPVATAPPPAASRNAPAVPRNQSASPTGPSPSSVAKQATIKNAINLRQVNLIGVYGTPSNRRALVRLSSGRYKKVKVGDRIDGGQIVAIGDSELRYQKGGRNVVLRMPRG
ncbi:hypothetical protein [Marinibacterium sp. SX1]|uniref:hypothetical protein n=1 Tax=Marinibacterium sp. SX1 TaxID=3388424 RepID=UPI003D172D48